KLKDETAAKVKVQGDLKKTQGLLTKSEANAKSLTAAGESAVETLKKVAEAAGSKFVDLKTSGASLVKDVKEVKSLSQKKDPGGDMRRLEGELGTAKAELGRRWSPAEMLAAWRDALPGDAGNALGERALKDADRVEALPGATDEQKAQAQLVRGLVLKNREK